MCTFWQGLFVGLEEFLMEEERLEDCTPSLAVPSASRLTASANLFFPGVGRDFIAFRENEIFPIIEL